MNRSLILIKPDALERRLAGLIIHYIEQELMIESMKMIVCDSRILEHYAEHREKDFYEKLIEFMISDHIIVIKVSCEDAVTIARDLCLRVRRQFGSTNPRNLIHASDSEQSALRELELWKGI